MAEFIMIIVSAVFINNFVVVQFLGICPFLGVSKDFKSALGMGLAVTFVMTITCLITYPIYTFILVPLEIQYMEIIVFIFIIASIVQMIEMALKKFSPTLYNAMGIYLPLITTNCAVLGVAELVIDSAQIASLIGIEVAAMNMGFAVLYGLFAGLGFTVAIVLMSGMREKVSRLPLNKHLKGFPIAMIIACFIAMAFYVFALI
ncbi:MAG: electron transport complex subunit RsxA [Clostridiales bacterium]|nr:electron transport complex subunit RsxA [Clostridiales bacterium]MBQ3046897.1 electron transport complex subunit RsxA [Clostridia bacterium]